MKLIKKKKIGMIAADNGYGHIRRLICIINKLDFNWDCYLICNKKKYNNLQHLVNKNNLNIIDFSIKPEDNLLNNYSVKKREINISRLDLKKYDVVITDNILTPIIEREDAYFSGSFIWEDLFYSKFNLKDYPSVRSVKTITSSLFSFKSVKKFKNNYQVGLYGFDEITKLLNNNLGSDILFSIGGGSKSKRYWEKITLSLEQYILNNASPPPGLRYLWVEPKFYNKKMPEWVRPASYDTEMYANLGAAIIRPGIGTVTDTLSVGAKIYCLGSNENLELIHNSNVLVKLKIGEVFDDLHLALCAALVHINNPNKINHSKEICKKINFDAAREAVSIIEN